MCILSFRTRVTSDIKIRTDRIHEFSEGSAIATRDKYFVTYAERLSIFEKSDVFLRMDDKRQRESQLFSCLLLLEVASCASGISRVSQRDQRREDGSRGTRERKQSSMENSTLDTIASPRGGTVQQSLTPDDSKGTSCGRCASAEAASRASIVRQKVTLCTFPIA